MDLFLRLSKISLAGSLRSFFISYISSGHLSGEFFLEFFSIVPQELSARDFQKISTRFLRRFLLQNSFTNSSRDLFEDFFRDFTQWLFWVFSQITLRNLNQSSFWPLVPPGVSPEVCCGSLSNFFSKISHRVLFKIFPGIWAIFEKRE